MLFYNKVLLLPELSDIFDLLQNNHLKKACFCFFYGDRIAISHRQDNIHNSIRIGKTRSFMDYWYNTFFCGKTFIGALDYIVETDCIKIDYINNCNGDGFTFNLYETRLTEMESKELFYSMVEFIKYVAKQEQKPKIKLDVHQNLRIYRKHFEELGFQVTGRKSRDNPFYLETELAL